MGSLGGKFGVVILIHAYVCEQAYARARANTNTHDGRVHTCVTYNGD